MPLNRLYESFDPRQTKFDVVIIDEASQSDVTALAALYLGCEHVVVGDAEQVTPDAIGQRVDEVVRLMSTELQGIPNNHLYDGQTSIYHLAEAAFGGVVALRETAFS
jgi:superfamily I DNA and/or RNA helicase